MWRCADSTTVADLPLGVDGYAGYLDGLWPTYVAMVARFPFARHISIATRATTAGADAYDVESGDLTPAQCPAVWHRERAAGREPVAYVNHTERVLVRAAFIAAAMTEPRYWLATLDGTTPWDAGLVAIQCDGQAQTGAHYDVSVVVDDWPAPRPKEDRMFIALAPDGWQGLVTGSLVVHIPDVPDSDALRAAGIPLVKLDQPLVDALKAAAAALQEKTSGTVAFSGSATLS